MAQTSDFATIALTGALPFILLLSAGLAWPTSLGLLRLYRRAVQRSMRSSTRATSGKTVETESKMQPLQPGQAAPDLVYIDAETSIINGVAEQIYGQLRNAPLRAAIVYAVAGFSHALVMVAVFLVANQIGFLLLRYLILVWSFAWPVVLTLNLVVGTTLRIKLTVTYFLILIVLSVLATVKSTQVSVGEIVFLWLVYNLLPTLLLLAFLNHSIRAVGPLVFAFMVLAVTGSQLLITAAASDDRLLRFIVEIGVAIGLGAPHLFILLILLGFIFFGFASWLALQWIKRLYEQKKISDQSISLDATWLLFTVVYSIFLAFTGTEWFLLGLSVFVFYRFLVWIGFTLLRVTTQPIQDGPGLLLLRVFSLGRRSEKLFEAIALHWRYTASIRFIAGPDLATATVEPHEFLDFLSGKLARRFIDSPQTLDLRLAEMDLRPDRDGRFRINDFFCYEDTWKMVLSRLASQKTAVLMDLRSFSPKNAGIIYEINELINLVPLGRVLFIVDKTTDEHFLRQTIAQSWTQMSPSSPNRTGASGALRLYRQMDSSNKDLIGLLRALTVAA